MSPTQQMQLSSSARPQTRTWKRSRALTASSRRFAPEHSRTFLLYRVTPPPPAQQVPLRSPCPADTLARRRPPVGNLWTSYSSELHVSLRGRSSTRESANEGRERGSASATTRSRPRSQSAIRPLSPRSLTWICFQTRRPQTSVTI